MTFKRDLWKEKFHSLPSWPCPTCRDGRLVVVKPSVLSVESDLSKAGRAYDEWEPDWIVKRFTAHMTCSDSSCGERVAVAGVVTTEMDYDYDNDGHTVVAVTDRFHPSSISPPPLVIEVPRGTPENVVGELQRASAVIWLDVGSSANKLRSAAEELLTALKIPRTYLASVKGGKKERRLLSLAKRIDRLRIKNADAANLLESIRWLGNVGTHDGLDQIDRNDLLNAFEIFQHVLEQIFDPKHKRLAKAAKDIARRRGRKPPRKKARRKKTKKP